jgi:hypothetical protein
MAWSWSHTTEAYDNAQENLSLLPREDLEVIYAEWRAAQSKSGRVDDSNYFNEKKYLRALKFAKTLPDDVLADFIWERASEHATCDNGGFNAWVCPSGCHSVPFGKPDDDDADDEDWPLVTLCRSCGHNPCADWCEGA